MPDMSQKLIEQVKTAITDKTPLRIEGGATKNSLGRLTEEAANIISTREHSGVIDYKPVELIMTVRGGTSVAEIDVELAKNNQILACDPRRYGGQATIGGSLATDQSGHARPWYGSLRDHVLGIKLINGHGEHLRFGGQVMKNVAGYDVSRLQAGAMGTFGVITEVSFKVLPKPEMSTSVCLTTDANQALLVMNKLARTAKPITAASWIDGQVYIRLEGASKAVDATVQQWQSEYDTSIFPNKEADSFWQSIREHEHDFYSGTEAEIPLWKFSVNAAAQHTLTDADWVFNWCGSQRWLTGEYSLEELNEYAKTMKGTVQHYSGGNRQQELAILDNAMLKPLMTKLKRSFDPENIFNPGRLYGWL